MWRNAIVGYFTLAVAAGAEKWSYAATDNFELFTTASPRRAREGLQFYEQTRSFFLEALRINPKLPARVRLIAFNTEKEWLPYRPNETAIAYYQPGLDRDFIVMRSLSSEESPTVVHEYVHLLIKHSGMELPIWMNEGFAELYSNMKQVGGKMQVGTIHLGRYQLLRQEKWLPLAKLLEVTHDSPEYNTKSHAGVFYSQAWALTHMLQLSDAYRPKSGEFVQRVTAGAKAADAFRAVYGKYLSDVEMDLKDYMNGDRFKVALFDYKPVKPEAVRDVREIPTFEAELALASLLSHTRDGEQARVLLERLKVDQPDNLELLEMLAFFHYHMHETKEANQYFAKAIDRGSKNHKVYFDYAHSIRGESKEKAMEAMRKAVELNPADVEYTFWFGQVLMENKRWGEALAELTKLKRVKPERAFFLFSSLTHCYVNLNNAEQAKISVDKAMEYARDDRQKMEAQRLLDFLEQRRQYEVQKKSYEAAIRARQSEPAPRRTETEDAPALQRRNLPPPPGSAEAEAENNDEEFRKKLIDRSQVRVTGKLRVVECLGSQARVHVQVGAKTMRFWIENPGNVAIGGAAGATVEFSCGPQKGATVTVGYTPRPDAKRLVEGDLTSLQFE